MSTKERTLNRFEGKKVYLTGAASGIGQATAIRLASEGASLYLTDLNEEGLAGTAEQCKKYGAKVVTAKLDVSSQTQVKATIADCTKQLGGIDAVLNIAGVLLIEHFEKTTLEQFDFLVNINIKGTFMVCQEAMPHLLASGGNIVNCSSSSAYCGVGYGVLYGATKGAVSAMTRGIAVEFAKKGIRCNTIIPGEVSTSMTAQPAMPDPESLDFSLMSRGNPLTGQAATPDQIASVIVMLASEDGAYINGAEIRADGGGLS
ncbi:SDR family oxidoreductase [Lutimonas saemankumensis]|uniref:SDR family NAD(P)-dependent oxidoreductase n=1 Tax=Lutimonas saemankumensis TaxID=483016 RepID=UPI001CD27918|nr:SDR family oxidoreductase [Lutimonas saemankumensis]MCA0932854.1 SDR family oxidoreductase [Lutimonas saemankumensis]